MKNPIRSFAWVIPSILLVFACSGVPGLATSTPVPSGGVLFEDDFADESKGWDTITDEYGTTAYADGKYMISVTDTLSYLFSDPDLSEDYADTQIDVDILPSDEQLHDMGIVCRVKDTDNFYYFIISSDGFYAIGKFKDGEDILLGSEEMQEDSEGVINQGLADNHVRADCIGETLTLYANGTKLFETTDSDFTEGAFGLIAGSYEDVPITVFFDNFVVTKP
jgi:hypothetical protein